MERAEPARLNDALGLSIRAFFGTRMNDLKILHITDGELNIQIPHGIFTQKIYAQNHRPRVQHLVGRPCGGRGGARAEVN